MGMGFGKEGDAYADTYLGTPDAVQMTMTTVCSLQDDDGYILSPFETNK